MPGVTVEGEYMVARHLPGVIDGKLAIGMAMSGWAVMSGPSMTFATTAGGWLEAMLNLSDLATSMSFGSYMAGIPQYGSVVSKDERGLFDLSVDPLPKPIQTKNVTLPEITSAKVEENGSLTFEVNNPATTPVDKASRIVLRAYLENGSYRDVPVNGGVSLAGNFSGTLNVSPPPGLAIGSAGWKLVRLVNTDEMNAAGVLQKNPQKEYQGNTVNIKPREGMGAVLTRTGVQFIRQNTDDEDAQILGEADLVKLTGDNDLWGQYLTGNKIQPIVMATKGDRCFVAGKGVVYVIDTISFKLIDAIGIPGEKRNISSLAFSNDVLYVGEGGPRSTDNRLIRIDVNPSLKYPKIVTLKGTGIEASKFGVYGLAIGPDDRTLVVTLPAQIAPAGSKLGAANGRGSVLVFDLDKESFDRNTGKISAPISAVLPADGSSAKTPGFVTATASTDKFFVSSPGDYNRGLLTLVIKREGGKPVSAKLESIPTLQGATIVRDRLDIQRAQSAVLVKYQGAEYAIVADDNYNYLDPYWMAMFEAPMFMQISPFGPPTPIGGSASAKKVSVGGKLGIIKDPFGAKPEFIGATLPLDGYGIKSLSISYDGKVLLGQLDGRYGTIDQFRQQPHQTHAWNIDALLAAALAAAPESRMTKHIKLPADAEQLIPTPASQPVGTAFNGPQGIEVKSSTKGNFGDVIEIDVKKYLAKELKVRESSLSGYTFEISDSDFDSLVAEDARFKLVTEGTGKNKTVLSRTTDLKSAVFETEGRFYVVPVISEADVTRLRLGERLDARSVTITVTYRAPNSTEPKTIEIQVNAQDFAETTGRVFFGDRPLDDPGYSELKLSDSVGIGKKNDVLDVLKVEQRLKYLGFSAMGQGRADSVREPVEFSVDGKWEGADAKAGYFFSKIVNYGSGGRNIVNVGHGDNFVASIYAKELDAQSRALSIDRDDPAKKKQVIDFLNAFNAPHWMNIGPQMQYRQADEQSSYALAGWVNRQTGDNREAYGTSWMRDLMLAKQYAPASLIQSKSWFNGAVDANHGYTPRGHSSHDLGMAFDFGISNYIAKGKGSAQENKKEPLTVDEESLKSNLLDPADPKKGTRYENIPDKKAYLEKRWSLSNALYLIDFLPEVEKGENQQRTALKDFLSLFAVTQNSDGGTWSALPVKNGAAVKLALFGNGDATTGLIESVLIGGQGSTNPYRNINEILSRLGVTSKPEYTHHHHFHVFLRPRAIPEAAKPLMAQPVAEDSGEAVSDVPQFGGLLDHVVTLIDFEEEVMFSLDVPMAAPQEHPAIIVQASSSAAAGAAQPDFILMDCMETEYPADGVPGGGKLSPQGACSSTIWRTKIKQEGVVLIARQYRLL